MLASEDMSGARAATPIGQEELEQAVLEVMLMQAASEPFGATLKMQIEHRVAVRRQLSGAGFFLEFAVDRTHPPLSVTTSPLPCDVVGRWPGKQLLAGFILFTDRSGYIDMLEGFTYDGDWLDDVTGFQLTNSLEEPILQ